jgi:plasmid stabilization system protein ParE
MPGVFLSQGAFDDLLRLENFLVESDDPMVGIGRPVEGGLRELIISRRRSGYLARYEFDHARDLVLVARIRHQRESGYPEMEL